MFLGHFATALAAKKLSPKASLGLLFLASQLLDLIWPVALLLGLEKARVSHAVPIFNGLDLVDAPYSHSLVMAFVWAMVFGGLIFVKDRDLRSGLVIGLIVVGHWFLDLLTHVPDLPLWFGGPKVGLGLWQFRDLSFLLELAMYALGAMLYWRVADRARLRHGVLMFLHIVLVTIAVIHTYLLSVHETESAIEIAAPFFGFWLLIGVACWAERRPSTSQN